MTMKIRILFTGLLMILATVGHAGLPDSIYGEALPSLAPLVEQASPAVVNIRVSQTVSTRSQFGDDPFRRFFGLPESRGGVHEVASAGSGVIVDATRGFILTNHHVVDSADKIQVFLIDGKVLNAEVVGSDAATDIAVLKVDAVGLVDMPIGESAILFWRSATRLG